MRDAFAYNSTSSRPQILERNPYPVVLSGRAVLASRVRPTGLDLLTVGASSAWTKLTFHKTKTHIWSKPGAPVA